LQSPQPGLQFSAHAALWHCHVVLMGVMLGPHFHAGSAGSAGALHTFPQAPQFRLSESSDTHSVPQTEKPFGHPQAPRQQMSPSLHVFPHAPQFLGSSAVDVSQPSSNDLLQSARSGLHAS
jgi:hypothetical protein